ncbi:MAG: hypothetical protein V1929_03460 [bacterium]
MKRCLICLAALSMFSGCTVIGGDLRKALEIQTHYTRQYVAATLPTVQDEQTQGIGKLLVENSNKIDELLK